MDFTGTPVLLINTADFPADHKAGIRLIRYFRLMFLPQTIKTRFRFHQVFPEFPAPSPMGKVTGSDQRDPFQSGPPVQVHRIAQFTRGHRKMGMYMKIRNPSQFKPSILLKQIISINIGSQFTVHGSRFRHEAQVGNAYVRSVQLFELGS